MRGKGKKRCDSQSLEILGLVEQKVTVRKPKSRRGAGAPPVNRNQSLSPRTTCMFIQQHMSTAFVVPSFTSHEEGNVQVTSKKTPQTQDESLTQSPKRRGFSTITSQHIGQSSNTAELQPQSNGVEVLPDTIPRTLQSQTQN